MAYRTEPNRVGPRRRLIGGLASLLLLFCSGCTEFAHGVVDKPLPNDVRLIGYWEGGSEAETSYVRITEESPISLRIDMIDREKCRKEEPIIATRTEIDGDSFLDLVIPQRDSTPLIFPISYDYDHGQLLIGNRLSGDDIQHAIETGALPGRIIKNKFSLTGDKPAVSWDKIYVDASTAELRQFVAAHSGPMGKPTLTFHRLASVALPCE